MILPPPPDRRSFVTSLATASALAWSGLWSSAAVAQSGRSGRNLPAEQFVQVEGQNMFSVLSDRSLGDAAKQAAFRRLIDRVADLQRISGFVLGKYARAISPAQRQQFNTVFRTYVQGLYQTYLANFRGDQLRVTGSTARSPTDTIVNTVIDGAADGRALPVAWRVLGSPGSFKVVDVQASGVWLAITLQQDFVSTIDNARGDIGVLIARLQSGD
ncbi:MAG: ABC transporter substrate-binding protein [Caulobacter sp.]|nr:ABC transporter substrate-binding protein [Caulobacter sp.]